MTQKDHYVYIYFRLNGTPCYVGRGVGNRYLRHLKSRKTNSHLWSIIQQAGGKIPVVKIREGLTKEESCEIEIAFIAALGREANGGPLVNLSDGGEWGSTGAKMSVQWRKNRSEKAIQFWKDPERHKEARERMIGNKFLPLTRSPEWRAKIGQAGIGNQRTLGLKHTAEAKEKMKIRWSDPEWREKEMQRRRDSGMYSGESTKRGWGTRRAKVSDDIRDWEPT